MVCIAEDYFGADIILQVTVIDSLDGAHGAYRHEYGRMDAAVVRGEYSGPRRAPIIPMQYLEFHFNFSTFNPANEITPLLKLFIISCIFWKRF